MLSPTLLYNWASVYVKEQQIADATADLRSIYYCEMCDKQYRTYSEYDNHLNSYAHHHIQVREREEGELTKFSSWFFCWQRLKELRQYETGRKFVEFASPSLLSYLSPSLPHSISSCARQAIQSDR